MNKYRLLFQSARAAFSIGSILALYISLTPFREMPHSQWLTFHNLLVMLSLTLTAFVGYKHRVSGFSFPSMLLSVACFFSVVMFLYVGSYMVTTTFFNDKMIWIPFFYHDYTYHGFQSVSDYLHHNNNFRELLELQIISFLISSVLYFTAGSLGYSAKALIDRMKKSSGAARSSV